MSSNLFAYQQWVCLDGVGNVGIVKNWWSGIKMAKNYICSKIYGNIPLIMFHMKMWPKNIHHNQSYQGFKSLNVRGDAS